jgi:hypothetical protein
MMQGTHGFHHENRLNMDDCNQKSREFQNQSLKQRNLYNFYDACLPDGGDEQMESFAIENRMSVKKGYGVTDGRVVDSDSQMRMDGEWTNHRTKNQLHTRWYQGVPNLNRGGLVPDAESRLTNSENTTGLHNCDRVTEKNFDRNIPLVGWYGKHVQNPDHIIEPWVRGGSHTRTEFRSGEYIKHDD